MDNIFHMYGVVQTPDGHVYSTSVKDIIEREIVKEENRKLVDEFVNSNKAVEQGLKQLETEFSDKLNTVGSGKKLFKVKKGYKSKFFN